MKVSLPIRHALIVLAVLAVASLQPAMAATYTIKDLGTLGGAMSVANAVNSNGQIAGQASNSAGSFLGFVDKSGPLIPTGTLLGGSGSTATGVNSSGVVVGSATDNLGYSHAFTNSGGSSQTLSGIAGGVNSYAMSVNSNGEVAGYADTALGAKHVVVWVNRNPSDIGTLGGWSALGESVNDTGHVAGYSFVPGNAATHAFYWDGAMHDLGTLGGVNSYAYGVNNSNVVVGWSYTSGNAARHAFYWNGSLHDIGALSNSYSYAYGVNNLNQIVGQSAGAAFLYANGTLTNLNSVLPANSGWTLSVAYGINDSGQIVGYGITNGQIHGFLLTPPGSAPPAPPAAPTGLAASSATGQAALNWSGSTGANSYNLYRSTSSNTETLCKSGLAATSFTDTGLTAGTTYFYKVTAVGPGGESAFSNEASGTPPAPVTTPPPSKTASINCGGAAIAPYAADNSFSGGGVGAFLKQVITPAAGDTATGAVYQTQRYGNFNYNIGGFTPGASCTVSLHFAESWFGPGMQGGGGKGSRTFNVAINGTRVLSNFDVLATAGKPNLGLIQTFTATANSSGVISLQFTSVVNNAEVNAIEVVGS
ncbi:MAG TPA: malectin domain-containing carbohydrate-binding protein [Capsulimonadaceae bacterium]|nr:malectin domain-containing carbohydrate-binding protein [Capsulimonadaceae bacterium]